MKLIWLLIAFAGGLGIGWLLFQPDTATKDSNADVKARERGVPIPLELASEMRDNYRPSNQPFKTEAIVHDLASLKEYLIKLEEFFKDNPTAPDCPGCTEKGVAIYFGKSFTGNYLYQKTLASGIKKSGYLLKSNYTAFLVPVLFGKKTETITFRVAHIDGDKKPNWRETVTIMDQDKFWSPIGDYKNFNDWDKKLRDKVIRFFDPEGFDLGHTRP